MKGRKVLFARVVVPSDRDYPMEMGFWATIIEMESGSCSA